VELETSNLRADTHFTISRGGSWLCGQ